MTATRRLGRLERKKEQGRKNKRGCARGDDGGGTCKVLSQPGSMAGITSGVRSGERRRFPPQLDDWGINMEGEKLGLTLVATGRSAGVGEAARCELAGWKKTAAWCRGNRGRWRVATIRSGSSSPDGSGLAKDGALPRTDSPPPAPSSHPPS
jgi:hypothetical protein